MDEPKADMDQVDAADIAGNLTAEDLHEVQSAPDGLLISGTFAIHKAPRGDLILVTEIPGRGIQKKVFPRALVKMAAALAKAKV